MTTSRRPTSYKKVMMSRIDSITDIEEIQNEMASLTVDAKYGRIAESEYSQLWGYANKREQELADHYAEQPNPSKSGRFWRGAGELLAVFAIGAMIASLMALAKLHFDIEPAYVLSGFVSVLVLNIIRQK